MQEALAKNEIAKIFVGGQQDTIGLQAPTQYSLVVGSRIGLGNKQNIVPIRAQPVNDLLVDILVRQDLHARVYSIG